MKTAVFKRIPICVALSACFIGHGALGQGSVSQEPGGQELTAHALQTGASLANTRESVLIYKPDFFAASNPATAQDMVNRLPGFGINNGDEVRGFAGAGGNVLINGARPASKTDNVTSVLGRIQKSRVSHIELIRGGAPGIDM